MRTGASVSGMSWRLRHALLVLVCALGVHHGRYALVPPGHHDDGSHGYLAFLTPALAATLLLAAGRFAVRLRRGADAGAPRPQLLRLWLTTAALLVAAYVAQESVEALLHGGRAHEIFALFGDGAWVVIPLSLIAGALVALALRGAAALADWVAARRSGGVLRAPCSLHRLPPRHVGVRRSALAYCRAPRGPPPVAAGA